MGGTWNSAVQCSAGAPWRAENEGSMWHHNPRLDVHSKCLKSGYKEYKHFLVYYRIIHRGHGMHANLWR